MESTQEHLARRERVRDGFELENIDWADVADYGAKVFKVEF